MSDRQLRWVSKRAKADENDRSEYTRRALRFASAYMPPEWNKAGDPVPWDKTTWAARPTSGPGELTSTPYREQT